MVSVYIRHLLVQLETPDAIRGRVSAVNGVFIGASNELGEFESGVVAAWFGAVPAVADRRRGHAGRRVRLGAAVSRAVAHGPVSRRRVVTTVYPYSMLDRMRRADRTHVEKGRGAVTNPAGRFESTTLEPADDGWNSPRRARRPRRDDADRGVPEARDHAQQIAGRRVRTIAEPVPGLRARLHLLFRAAGSRLPEPESRARFRDAHLPQAGARRAARDKNSRRRVTAARCSTSAATPIRTSRPNARCVRRVPCSSCCSSVAIR